MSLVRLAKRVLLASLCSIPCWPIVVTVRAGHADETVPSREEVRRIQSDRNWNGRRLEYNGCVLRLLLPEISERTDVPLSIVVENRGRTRFQCGASGYFLHCVLTLTSRDGEPVPYSTTGAALFRGHGGQGGQFGRGLFAPGQFRSWEYNLADAFEPLKEGEYLLTVEAKIQFETPDSMEGGTPTFGKPVSFLARNVPLIISSESSPRE